ncbi:MAG: sugar phosphate isomerase/epimerase family protein [Anaerovoracaceae bacterium]
MKDRLLLGNNAQFIRHPFSEFTKAAAENGLDAVELTLQTPHFYADSETYHDLSSAKRNLQETGLKVCSTVPLPYRYSICADEGTIQREKTLGYYRQCILLTEELGASYLSITGSGANYDYDPKRLMKNGAKTLEALADFAGKHGVTLLLGSVLGKECMVNASTPVLVSLEEIREMTETVSSKYLKVYLDTEVISLRGETISGWFDTFGEDIRLVRFTDGNYNGYRIWGRGCLPCRKYLHQLCESGYAGPLALTVPGERYIDDPVSAMKENIQVLRQSMGQV